VVLLVISFSIINKYCWSILI